MPPRFLMLVLGAVSWCALPGCRQGLPAAADPQQARAALCSSLDAWKSGAPADHPKQQSPPVFFRDEDWNAGWKLQSYRMTLDDEPFGQQRRYYVHLSMVSAKGKAAAKEVQYLVDTSPALVVMRVSD